MDILLIGGKSSLMGAMIGKLYKEGHRIYVMTERRNFSKRNRKVFEYYYFPYESKCLKEVFDSVNPDVVLFTGAYDSSFKWNDVQREAIQYSSAMLNIMMAFSMRKRGRFIYLSSAEVYEDSYPNTITEDMKTSPVSFRSMVLAEAERTCLNYHTQRYLDTVVLRLENLYEIPYHRSEANNIVGKMCIEAMSSGKISCDSKHSFSLLSMSDAVNFIYRIIACEEHRLPLYNLSSSRMMNEQEVATIIAKNMDEDIELLDTTTDRMHQVVLSNQLFMQEFEEKIFHEPEEKVAQIVEYMMKNKSRFLVKKEPSGFFASINRRFGNLIKVIIPYLECMTFFIPFFMLNNRATGNRYFANLDFYLLYVLLFAIIHGQSQATFAAILAVGGYIFRHMYGQTALEVMMDFNTCVWIAQLFIVGLVVGYMKDKLRLVRSENQEEIEFLEEQLDDIKEINISNSRMKNLLTTQIVNQQDSMGRIYEITSSLTECDPNEVINKAAQVIERLMETKHVAIYTHCDEEHISLRVATSKEASVMGELVHYEEIGDILSAAENDSVYINKKMDDHYPLMARAIYEGDKIFFIIMVWGLPWERMNLSQANLLTIIARLTEHILLRAERYLENDREKVPVVEIRMSGKEKQIVPSKIQSVKASELAKEAAVTKEEDSE